MTYLIKNSKYTLLGAMVGLVAVVVAGCSSSSKSAQYTQIERLARPAINEGLVIQNAHLNAWNSIAPSVDLTSAAAPVVSDASTTLQALYAGACFTNGALTQLWTQANLPGSAPQLKPAGQTCQATGTNVLNANLVGLNSTFAAAATAYANLVLGQFAPDVMRIDTSVASGYAASLCNGGQPGSPLLCGGRKLDDDVIGTTYAYLLNGEATAVGSVVSSIRAGVYYNPAVTDNSCTVVPGVIGSNKCNNNAGQSANSRQGHKPSNGTMPFGAAPYL